MNLQFIVPLLLIINVQDDSKSAGLEAYRRRDYRDAHRLLMPLAEAGDHEAQQYIADLYYGGQGVPRDVKTAVVWFERAAAGGNLTVKKNLGAIYMSDPEVLDLAKAESWYRQTAEAGDVESMTALAAIVLASHNDTSKAQAWLLKAAEAGHEDAMISVGRGYFDGQVFPQNYERAHYWFDRLAQKNVAYGHNGLGTIYSKGLYGVRDMPKALFHFQHAANAGLAVAQFNAGKVYLEGDGVDKDFVRAWHWLSEASRRGNAHAILYVGNAYASGLGVATDKVRALVAFRLYHRVDASPEVKDIIRSVESSLDPKQHQEAERLYSGINNREIAIDAILPTTIVPNKAPDVGR